MRKINQVLLVDDNYVDNYLNKSIFNRIGIANEVISKSNGKEALAYLEKDCKNEVLPELILLDLKMPVMDGFEFIQEFERICMDFKHTIHIVILSTSKNADDHLKLRQLGSYFYVNKPLTSEKVLDIHHRYFREVV